MAKKRATNKSKSKSSSKPKVKKQGKVKSKTSLPSKAKPKGKKRGRKPSTPNRYNAIKSAISNYYQSTIGRNVKRFEMKVIYQWVKENYATQSVKYVVMNIDVIIDTFWKEYCNLYPVDLQNHARFFDWYYLKDYLTEERAFHYPTDVIQVDLTAIGGDVIEFFMEDYIEQCDAYYSICTGLGIRSYEYPMMFLKDAFCDIGKKGNLYQYVLTLDEDGGGSGTDSGSTKPKGGGSGRSSEESSSTSGKTSSNDEVGDGDNQSSVENTSKIDSNEGKGESKGKVETKGESSATGKKTAKKDGSEDDNDKDNGNSQAQTQKNKENEQTSQKNKELEIEILKQKEKEAIAQKELLKQKTQSIIELKKAGLSIQEIKELLG
jgi:hypothetical protein